MENSINFLYIAGCDFEKTGLHQHFAAAGITYHCLSTGSRLEVIKALDEAVDLDAILSYGGMPDLPFTDLLKIDNESAAGCLPVVVVVEDFNLDESIALANAGAYRYLPASRPDLIITCLLQAAAYRRDCDVQKSKETILRGEEELYRQLVEIYPESIAVTDLVGNFVKVNQETLRFYGFTRAEQMLGKNYLEFVAPEDRQKAMDNARITYEKGKSKSLLTMLTPDGERAYLEFTTAVMVDEAGKPRWFIGAGRDVTEWKKAEEAIRRMNEALELRVAERTADLEASKQQLEKLLLVSRIVIFSLEPEPPYRVTFTSDNLYILFGELLPEYAPGNSWLVLVHPEDRDWVRDELVRLPEARQLSFEIRVCKPSVPYRWVHFDLKLNTDSANQPIEIAGSLYDVSQRMEIEEALRKSEEAYRSLAEASQDFIFVVSEDNRVSYVNNSACRILGKPCEEIIGQLISDLFVKETAIRQLDSLMRVKKSGQPEYIEDQTAFTLENIHWLGTWLIPMKGKDGNYDSVLGIARDITERKQAEQELERALEKERDLNTLKSEFISRTSHEFRTPLSTILSSAELLEHYGPEWSMDKIMYHLHRIQQTSLDMAEILEDILLVEKAEAGKLKIHLTRLDVCEFFNHMVDEQQLRDQHRHPIQFRCEDCFEALVDSKLLHQVVYNLLSNAIKYSADGMPVEVSLTCQDNLFHIVIQDHGMGISEEDQRHLFERFYRSEAVSHLPGSGLGLTIVKEAIELMHGNILVESHPGAGTKFTITLPVLYQATQEDQTTLP